MSPSRLARGIEHLVQMVNSHLGHHLGVALVVVPSSRQAGWVAGCAFELHALGSRRTIPLDLAGCRADVVLMRD
jgi:hypothetical protein